MVVVGIPVLVLVGLAIIYTLFTALIVYPWIDEQFGSRNQPWWKRAALWPITKIAKLSRKLVHRLTAHFAQIFVNSEPSIARFIRRQATTIEQLSGVVESSVQATYESLVYVRRVMVPTLIEKAVAPVRIVAQTALKEERAIKVQLNTARGYINDMLRDLPWGAGATFELAERQFAGAFRQLWRQFYTFRDDVWKVWLVTVWTPALKQLTFIWDDLYRSAKDGLDGIRARLLALEKGVLVILEDPTTWVLTALGLAAVPVLSASGMRTALQALTCRNTQTVAKSICAMDEALLAELLAGTFLFGLILDPKLVARVGQEVEGSIEFAFREMAGL